MRDAILLYNPGAGRRPPSTRLLQKLVDRLQAGGVRTEVAALPNRHLGMALPALEGKDLVLVYGGDGSVHDALNLILPRPVPIALLPAGTANVLARELGIPRDPERALEVVFEGAIREIYVGHSGGHYFHLMAGVGLDGYVISRVSRLLKRSLGIGAFWLAGFAAFWRYPMPVFQVEIEGIRYASTFTVVANARLYGGSLAMAPRADLSRPELDVCIFTSTNRMRYLAYLEGVLRGRHVYLPDVLYVKATRVHIEGPPWVAVQMDGELAGSLPRTFSIAQDSVRVYAPRCAGCTSAPAV